MVDTSYVAAIVVDDNHIAEVLAGESSRQAEALFTLYRTSPDKDSFVAALIGRCLVTHRRSQLTTTQS